MPKKEDPPIPFSERPPIKPKGKKSRLITEEGLIEEICEYLDLGATDTCISRIIGVNPATFIQWKTRGQEENGDKYEEFYQQYQLHRGKRELSWLDGIDGKWMLTHHPDTKYNYAEPRFEKHEYSVTNVESEERKKKISNDIQEGLDNLEFQIDEVQMIDEGTDDSEESEQ